MRRITRLLKKLKFWQYSSASQVPKADSVFENLTLSLLTDRRVLHGLFKGMKYRKLPAVGSPLCPILQGLVLPTRLHAAVPQLAPRKARWPQKEREVDAIHRAGSIAFVIEKVAF